MFYVNNKLQNIIRHRYCIKAQSTTISKTMFNTLNSAL